MTASGSLAWTTPATVLRAFVRDLRSGAPHLRTRGTLVLLALAGYLAFMCGLVVHQAQAVQRTLAEAEAIGRAADALDGLAFDTAASASAQARARRADANLLAADAALGPSLRRDVAAAVERAERLGEGASDAERAHAAHGLRRVSALLHAEAGQHADSLRLQVRRDAIVLVATGLVGIAILGFAILRFLGRLSAELTAARLRAVDIVDGKVAPPAAPQDEVGQLSAVIDQLAAALAARRNELEIERRKRFHEEKMAAIGSLAAGVLTEIGNPIAAIDGFARAMKDGDAARLENGSGNGDEPADAILEQTARLLVVARQIEEFTAPRPLQRQLVDVNGVVEAALGFLRYDESMQSIRVELALDRQLPAVTGIPDRLVQLVMNLVGNAADALAGKPRGEARVSIATRRAADAVVLEVADNGTGMREEVRARAFEPFFSTKPHGQGTGLGLPLCNSIVGDHGGLIHVDSAPGRGTSVTIRLPFARGESR
jgi:signal transduction histidine kinase